LHGIGSVIISHKEIIGLWAGAICTLAIFSLLYKENPVYRLAEHVFIGLAMGYGVFITWSEVLQPKWWDPMVNKGQWWWALAITPGLMYYFIYSKHNVWISRIILGATFGFFSGLAFQGFANTYIPMVGASFKPLAPTPGEAGIGAFSSVFNNVIFVVVLVAVMGYFFFSIDHSARSVRHTAALGRWFLMFAFGAMFGATVMARMALFIGRVDFLRTDFAPFVPAWFWYVAIGLVIAAVLMYLTWPKPPTKPEEADAEEAAPS
jgi:hypothetical protein